MLNKNYNSGKGYKNAAEKPPSISIFLGYENISQNKVYSCTPAVTISHHTGQNACMHVLIHTHSYPAKDFCNQATDSGRGEGGEGGEKEGE